MEFQPTTRKARMTKYLAVEACIALVLLAICPRVSAQSVRTGPDAYGDWRTDAPGVMRKITPADLPAPGATPSTANRSKVVPKPANATLKTMPGQLRSAQKVFASTGGLHAAALLGADGTMFAVREDIGRHNAVDKVIGWAVEHDRIPLSASVLLVSGRASFELTQKALLAGIPVLAAVSAPSSLAVSLAEECGITLVAFLRGDSMNVYTRADRITH